MAKIEEYKLKKNVLYTYEVRAGPINSNTQYSIPVHSNIESSNPVKGLLERIGLDLAKQLSTKTGQHIRVSLIVKEEPID